MREVDAISVGEVSPVRLEIVQTDFAAALLDDRVAPALLPALRDPGAHALDRLALYRSNLHAAWEKSLTNAFPVVHALVGAEFFGGLARAYGRACPSASGDLNRFGALFAGFVAAFEPARALPYLGDVAALEWAVHCAHSAPDAAALARERMAVISPQVLLTSRFALHPACRWIESRFPIASIWRAHQPQAAIELPESLDRAECALIVRPGWRAEVVESSGAEVAALEQLRAGVDMDGAIGAAMAADCAFDFAKTVLRWLDLAILVDIR